MMENDNPKNFTKAEENYYQVLNLSYNATREEVRMAYEIAMQTFHENSLATYSLFSDEENDEIMRKITMAYMTLVDSVTRQEYDRKLLQQHEFKKQIQTQLTSNEDGPEVLELSRPPQKRKQHSKIPTDYGIIATRLREDTAPTRQVSQRKGPAFSAPSGLRPLPSPPPSAPQVEKDLHPHHADQSPPENRTVPIQNTTVPSVVVPQSSATAQPVQANIEPAKALQPPSPAQPTLPQEGLPKPLLPEPEDSSLGAVETSKITRDAHLTEFSTPQRIQNHRQLTEKNVETANKTKEYLASLHTFSGAALQQIRMLKDINLTSVATETCVREFYLQALEDEEFRAFNALVYMKGYLRSYAKVLDLPVDRVVEDFIKLYETWAKKNKGSMRGQSPQ